jgi:hypothetical protein
MSHSFPSSRRPRTCPWYIVGGKRSNKNLEQWTNIKFCVKTGKINGVFLNGIGGSRKSKKMCKMTKK